MRLFWFVILMVSRFEGLAQKYEHDWDTYLMEVNKKPVSIIVDLGLAAVAPLKERPYVVLVRTTLLEPDENGLPKSAENITLNQLEDSLVQCLGKKSGAIYAGRFTQRGLREYYFYVLDTISYLSAVNAAMKYFPAYKWLSMAKYDKTWSNYFDVLYPPPVEMEKIQNRRVVDELKNKGDALEAARKIDHFLYFKTKSGREAFIRDLGESHFAIEEMPEEVSGKDYPYLLHISRPDIPGYLVIDRVTIPLSRLARKHNGKYDGWETYVVH